MGIINDTQNYVDPAGMNPLPPMGIHPQAVETPAGTVHNLLGAVAESHQRFLGHAKASEKSYSEPGLNDLHDRFGRAAQPYLDTAQAILEDREANAEKHYAEVLAAQNHPLDVSGELRADRHLRRVEKTLQNTGDGQAATTAQRLITEAPAEVRGVLLQEIPRMLDDRGLPGGEIVAQAAEAAIPELAEAAKERVKATQTRQLLGAEIARERAAQAEHRRPYVKHSDMTVIDRYNPDLR
jgi:hypothetical protein